MYRTTTRNPGVYLFWRVPGEFVPRASWTTPRAALDIACELAYRDPAFAANVALDASQAATSGGDYATAIAARALVEACRGLR